MGNRRYHLYEKEKRTHEYEKIVLCYGKNKAKLAQKSVLTHSFTDNYYIQSGYILILEKDEHKLNDGRFKHFVQRLGSRKYEVELIVEEDFRKKYNSKDYKGAIDEHVSWIGKNVRNRWTFYDHGMMIESDGSLFGNLLGNRYTFQFENPNDAVMFKLIFNNN